MQDKPASVPMRARQVGDAQEARERRSRWLWVEASVWTDRMLAALENGVKGDVWFSLIDKVYNPRNLWAAWSKSGAIAKSRGWLATE